MSEPDGRFGAFLRERRDLRLAAVFALVLLVAGVAGPMVVDARPAFEIPVEQASADDNPGQTTADVWDSAPAATVSISSAGAGVPAADNTTVESVDVEALQTTDRLYLRVSWNDTTRDMSTGDTQEFADAVAVQMPVNSSARPPIAMGGTDNQVNVWYWAGDNSTEELLAGGAGTTTQFDEQLVETNATYNDGRWQVVFSRPLDASAQNRTTIPDGKDMDVAVAVWNGSNMERSGQKAASSWYYLAMGPGPDGPPYETILWIVAGVAIVLSALVTVEGVRRTRGE